ncbi:MAG: retroviral-like aspartic protease family protein [Elusimicrobia bacterium]|nr:retroviral-like aspartic protease family protein [Elusimicrobiota bacterium]
MDLILDSGAVFTSISWADLKIIGYDPAIIKERQEIVTANGIIEVPKLKVKSIRAGDVEAQEVEVICHDIPSLTGVRGLLGLSFLKNFVTIMNYKEKYLEIL